jgi:hypothetical protein
MRTYAHSTTHTPTSGDDRRPTIRRSAKRQLSTSAKVGYSMIPVAILIIALSVVCHIWYRKRRAARKQAQVPSPPAPEEGYNDHRSSKVCSMAAFAAPFHPEEPRTGPAQPELPTVQEDKDSPVDEGSPFRLKKAYTVKKYNLTPDVARTWGAKAATEGRRDGSKSRRLSVPGVGREIPIPQKRSGGRGG